VIYPRASGKHGTVVDLRRGPTGPIDKQLDRKEAWPQNQWSGGQKVRTGLDAGSVIKEWFNKLKCFGNKKKKNVTRVKVSGEIVG
jgi:hypothetical protein